ncbi:MAG: DUF3809 domain-containing protein [Thermaceae bacterium]|nr:DUF3809 domain-containing protein [Thermaceae bacterium]
MILEKRLHLRLAVPPEHLLEPEQVFAGRPPFGRLERNGELLEGELVAEIPLLGDIHFPFRSRIVVEGEGSARLEPVPMEHGEFWVELAGAGRVMEGTIAYDLELRVHAGLPEGEKWGGRALRRMAEAAFERNLNRALEELGEARLSRE